MEGNKERTQEPTAANKTSSRSHAILQVMSSSLAQKEFIFCVICVEKSIADPGSHNVYLNNYFSCIDCWKISTGYIHHEDKI